MVKNVNHAFKFDNILPKLIFPVDLKSESCYNVMMKELHINCTITRGHARLQNSIMICTLSKL
jgi:hypothetical protein